MGLLTRKSNEDTNEDTKFVNAKEETKPAKAKGADQEFSYEVKDLPGSQKELAIKVTPQKFVTAFEKAYSKLAPKVEISGFRAGKAPRNLIEAKLGARIYEEAINILLPEITTKIVVELDLNPLDYAQYQVKKVSKDDGLEYSAIFTVMPEVKLPDFKSLKSKREVAKVDKKELDESMERLVKSLVEDEKKPQKREEIDWAKEMQDEELKTEAAVRTRMEKILNERRAVEAEDKFVDALVRETVAKAEITAPKALVDAEVLTMERQYQARIEQLGIKVDDFLKAQNTDLETMRKNWRKDAEFKVAADMLFIAIAKAHEIKVDDAMIDTEINKIADEKVRASYENQSGRNYITSVLIRQQALAKLMDLAGVEKLKHDHNKTESAAKPKK